MMQRCKPSHFIKFFQMRSLTVGTADWDFCILTVKVSRCTTHKAQPEFTLLNGSGVKGEFNLCNDLW